jgi:hypothetical protein
VRHEAPAGLRLRPSGSVHVGAVALASSVRLTLRTRSPPLPPGRIFAYPPTPQTDSLVLVSGVTGGVADGAVLNGLHPAGWGIWGKESAAAIRISIPSIYLVRLGLGRLRFPSCPPMGTRPPGCRALRAGHPRQGMPGAGSPFGATPHTLYYPLIFFTFTMPPGIFCTDYALFILCAQRCEREHGCKLTSALLHGRTW